MTQFGSNNSRAQREQALGGSVARLLNSGQWAVGSGQDGPSQLNAGIAGVPTALDLSPGSRIPATAHCPLPTAHSLSEITPLLCRSGAGALAWWNIRDTPLQDTPAGRELHEVYRRQRLSALRHERDIVEVISLLRAEGIEPVLVKGWAMARRYPDPALRPYGDIDLCVAPVQFAKAKRVIEGIASVAGPFVDLHSGFANIGVDTRRAWLRKLFSVQPQCPLCLGGKCFVHKTHHRDTEDTEVAQRQSADDGDWDELYARSQVVYLSAVMSDVGQTKSEPEAVATGSTLDIGRSTLHSSRDSVATTTPRELPARGPRSAPGSAFVDPQRGTGFPVRILCDEDHLRLLCLHLLRSGARRPAWLCDVALILEQVSSLKSQVSGSLPRNLKLETRNLKPGFDWSVCQGRNPVHAEWVGIAILLAHELLGADISQTPFAGRQLPRWIVPAVLEQWGKSADYAGYADNTGYQRASDLFIAYRRNLRNLRINFFDLYARWDNPIRATAAVGGQFNNWPRLPYRVAESLLRLGELPEKVRGQRQRPEDRKSDARVLLTTDH